MNCPRSKSETSIIISQTSDKLTDEICKTVVDKNRSLTLRDYIGELLKDNMSKLMEDQNIRNKMAEMIINGVTSLFRELDGNALLLSSMIQTNRQQIVSLLSKTFATALARANAKSPSSRDRLLLEFMSSTNDVLQNPYSISDRRMVGGAIPFASFAAKAASALSKKISPAKMADLAASATTAIEQLPNASASGPLQAQGPPVQGPTIPASVPVQAQGTNLTDITEDMLIGLKDELKKKTPKFTEKILNGVSFHILNSETSLTEGIGELLKRVSSDAVSNFKGSSSNILLGQILATQMSLISEAITQLYQEQLNKQPEMDINSFLLNPSFANNVVIILSGLLKKQFDGNAQVGGRKKRRYSNKKRGNKRKTKKQRK